jgi:cobalt/nickel transport system ATP-binding protein
MSFIELKNITFTYEGEEKPVIKDFNLSLEEGTCLAIMGENGSGKTTLFRILNGLSFPQKGNYIFGGDEITEKYLKNNQKSKLYHKKIGYLFQNPDVMLFNGTVYDEIAFGPRQMGLTDEEIKKRTEDCLRLFDIENLSDKAPYHLSGGQKKKVALAAVMSLNPDVLILDEPFAGFDGKTQEWLMSFLTELKKNGKTIIIATHNSEVASTLADSTIVMKEN